MGRAFDEFQQLASLPTTEEEFRLFGIAGQAIVHGLRLEHLSGEAATQEKKLLIEKTRKVADQNAVDKLDPDIRSELDRIVLRTLKLRIQDLGEHQDS